MPEHPRRLTVVHDCGVVERPCPRVECRYHLANGERPEKFARREDKSQTCALDVAEEGPLSTYAIARLTGMQRSWVEAVEYRALMKLREAGLLRRADAEDVRPALAPLEARLCAAGT